MNEKNNKIIKKLKLSFVATTLLVAAAHLFAFVNIEYSHDSVLYYSKYNFTNPFQVSGMISEGRFFQPILAWLIYGRTQSPWVTGIITMIAISLSVFVVSITFDMKKWQIICTSFFLSCNLALISIIGSFGADAAMYSVSMLLAFLSVWSYEKAGCPWNYILFNLFSVLSLGIYQAHIGIIAGMMALVMLAMVLQYKPTMVSFIMDGIKRLFCIGICSCFYLVIMKMSFVATGINASARYNGPARLHDLSLSDVVSAIPNIYKHVISYFTIQPYIKVRILLLNILLFGTALFFACLICLRQAAKERLGMAAMFLILLLIFPLAVGCIEFVSFDTLHHLMVYSYCLGYLVPVLIIGAYDWKNAFDKKGIVIGGSCLASLCIFWHNALISNGYYTYKKIIYDNTALHFQQVCQDIYKIPGYINGETEVNIVGTVSDSNIAYQNTKSELLYSWIEGYTNSATGDNPAYIPIFMRVVEGKDINMKPAGWGVASGNDVKQMPCYPVDGYCQMLNGQVIVKISETDT